jgi:hypothetical protein
MKYLLDKICKKKCATHNCNLESSQPIRIHDINPKTASYTGLSWTCIVPHSFALENKKHFNYYFRILGNIKIILGNIKYDKVKTSSLTFAWIF